VDRNVVRWYERNIGYASSAQANNAFGVTDDLNLVSVETVGMRDHRGAGRVLRPPTCQ
jgi:hypothetical protein